MSRRICAVALLAALVAAAVSGCGKKPPPPPPPGPAPVGPGPGPVVPVMTDPEGGVARPVPEKDKSIRYRSIFRIIKAGDDVVIDDMSLARDKERQVWTLKHAELEKKFEKLPDDSHIYVCLEGTRLWEKHWMAPRGKVGEKNEYTLNVDRIVWEKPQNPYFDEMTILESEIDEQYFKVCTEDPRKSLAEFKKVQMAAYELGYMAETRVATDPTLPLHELVSAVETICALMDEVERKAGDATEIIARLRLQGAWEQMPFNPAAGGIDEERGKQAEEARATKARLAGQDLVERIKANEVDLDAAGATDVLAKTSSTLVIRLMNLANGAGKTRMMWNLALAVFTAPVNDPRVDQRKTALSSLKSAVTSNPDFWKPWTDEELVTLPRVLKDAVIGFTKGDVIASRNAWMMLENLKKARPGISHNPPIDDVVKELKAK